MKNIDLVQASIESFNDGQFKVVKVTDTILDVSPAEGGVLKYVIFENEEIYQSIESFMDHVQLIREKIARGSETLRIPYFAGFSGYDLGEFLLDEPKNIDMSLDKKIDFSLKPCNFNINGHKYFADYLEELYTASPIFKGNNNYKDYAGYFMDEVEKNDFRINLVLSNMQEVILPDHKGVQELFKVIRKAKEAKEA